MVVTWWIVAFLLSEYMHVMSILGFVRLSIVLKSITRGLSNNNRI